MGVCDSASIKNQLTAINNFRFITFFYKRKISFLIRKISKNTTLWTKGRVRKRQRKNKKHRVCFCRINACMSCQSLFSTIIIMFFTLWDGHPVGRTPCGTDTLWDGHLLRRTRCGTDTL